MQFDVDWVDAFSDIPFGGNGCAVVHDAAQLCDETCMAFVRETSLVECTFTGPSRHADIRVRYFLASREIPFAGHPTVATIAAMRHRNLIADGAIRIETLAGVISAEVADGQVTMTQIAPVFDRYVPASIVAAVGGIDADAILHRPRLVSTGLPFCITVVKDRETLDSLRLDMGGLRAYSDYLGGQGIDIMEPFWVVQEGATESGDTYARLLLAPPSPAEDPFTGSATGAMGAYLWSEGLIQSPDLVAEQGHAMGRPGRAKVEVIGARDMIEGVKVSGCAHVLMSGTLFL